MQELLHCTSRLEGEAAAEICRSCPPVQGAVRPVMVTKEGSALLRLVCPGEATPSG